MTLCEPIIGKRSPRATTMGDVDAGQLRRQHQVLRDRDASRRRSASLNQWARNRLSGSGGVRVDGGEPLRDVGRDRWSGSASWANVGRRARRRGTGSDRPPGRGRRGRRCSRSSPSRRMLLLLSRRHRRSARQCPAGPARLRDHTARADPAAIAAYDSGIGSAAGLGPDGPAGDGREGVRWTSRSTADAVVDRGRARAQSLLDVLRGALRPALDEGRLRARGIVRRLHGHRRRARGRVLRAAGGAVRGPRRSRRSRACRADVRALWADAFVATGASQCGYCSPGIVMKAEALLRREPGARARRPSPAPWPATSAAAPGTRRSSTRSSWPPAGRGERRPGAARRWPPPAPARRRRSARDRTGRELALGEKPFVGDLRRARACSTARCASRPSRARSCGASTRRARAAVPGVVAVVDRGRRARASASRGSSSATGRCSSPRARRRATSATCWPRSPRETPRGAPRRPRRSSTWSTRSLEPVTDPFAALGRRRPGDPRGRQPRLARPSCGAATSTRPSPGPPTCVRDASGRSRSSTPSSSRRRASPCRRAPPGRRRDP